MLNEEYQEWYTKYIEHNLYEGWKKIWNTLMNWKDHTKEYIQINPIDSKKWAS